MYVAVWDAEKEQDRQRSTERYFDGFFIPFDWGIPHHKPPNTALHIKLRCKKRTSAWFWTRVEHDPDGLVRSAGKEIIFMPILKSLFSRVAHVRIKIIWKVGGLWNSQKHGATLLRYTLTKTKVQPFVLDVLCKCYFTQEYISHPRGASWNEYLLKLPRTVCITRNGIGQPRVQDPTDGHIRHGAISRVKTEKLDGSDLLPASTKASKHHDVDFSGWERFFGRFQNKLHENTHNPNAPPPPVVSISNRNRHKNTPGDDLCAGHTTESVSAFVHQAKNRFAKRHEEISTLCQWHMQQKEALDIKFQHWCSHAKLTCLVTL